MCPKIILPNDIELDLVTREGNDQQYDELWTNLSILKQEVEGDVIELASCHTLNQELEKHHDTRGRILF